MPRITVSGGPSYAHERPGEGPSSQVDDAVIEEREQPAEPEGQQPAAEEEGEQVEEAGVKRPALGDPKPDWVAFALAVNATFGAGDVPMPDDEVQASTTTKTRLQDIYSGYGE
jgi:hypothetical protein